MVPCTDYTQTHAHVHIERERERERERQRQRETALWPRCTYEISTFLRDPQMRTPGRVGMPKRGRNSEPESGVGEAE